MKEDRKPLTYITSGIVAMKFCWRNNTRRQRIFREGTFDVEYQIYDSMEQFSVTLGSLRVLMRYMEM